MELLVVISIISVLAAITFAILPSAVQPAQVTSTKSKLHQISVAIELYRSDYDGGEIGDLGDLGLPPVLTIATGPRRFLGLPDKTWVSSCAPHPHAHPAYTTMFYFPSEGGRKLVRASTDLQDKLLLVADDACNSPDVLIQSPYVTKRGLGILLNGTLVDRRAQGDLHDPYWWSNPMELN